MKHKYFKNLNFNYFFMDTDFIVYDMKTNDIYGDIKNDISTKFDTSGDAKDSVYNFPLTNKKVLRMIKCECNGKAMKEFIGLRAKMYSVKIDKVEKEIKKIKQCVTNKLSISDFRKCLLHIRRFCGIMETINLTLRLRKTLFTLCSLKKINRIIFVLI